MRTLMTAILAAVVPLQIASAQVQIGTAADEAAIRAVLDARNAAYNRHDATAMTSVYAPDADLVTGAGRYLKGRMELEDYYADLFKGADRNAVVQIDSARVRFVT